MTEPFEPNDSPVTRTRSRRRFDRTREQILSVATGLINDLGTKGMTLQHVAHAMDLTPTSVGYYFKRKELLAAAVFQQTLQRIEAMAQEAAREAAPVSKVHRLIALNIDLHARVLSGEGLPLASLSDLRTLDPENRAALERHFQAIFREVRGFFGEAREPMHKALLTARTHVLFEAIFWMPIWIKQYALAEFPRVERRLMELLTSGLAPPRAVWRPIELAYESPGEVTATSHLGFLRAATKLINEAGYRGASVERIAEALQVTKGSFYHHVETKDDLVLECFRRSYQRISAVKTLAQRAGGDAWQQLSSALGMLLDMQFKAELPLMRTSALRSLPPAMRDEVVVRSNRVALRFAGILADGISEGSLASVDPMIGSQLILSAVNSACDLRTWAARMPREIAVALYASTLTDGLFRDDVLTRIGKAG